MRLSDAIDPPFVIQIQDPDDIQVGIPPGDPVVINLIVTGARGQSGVFPEELRSLAENALQGPSNLADLPDKPVARSNIGLLRPISFQIVQQIPLANELLLLYPVIEPFTLEADLAGTLSCIIEPPASNFVIDIQRQIGGLGLFTSIGSITITPAGVVTLSTVGGTTKNIATGDILKILGDSDGDSAFQGAFNLYGAM